jgi:anti-anti-sigma factor
MSLSLTTRFNHDVCFAAVTGSMTLGPLLPKLTSEIKTVIERARILGLVIDLTDVVDVDSAGLGELVNIYKIAADRNLRLAVTGLSRRASEMFELTHLNDLIRTYETPANAEAAIRGA